MAHSVDCREVLVVLLDHVSAVEVELVDLLVIAAGHHDVLFVVIAVELCTVRHLPRVVSPQHLPGLCVPELNVPVEEDHAVGVKMASREGMRRGCQGRGKGGGIDYRWSWWTRAGDSGRIGGGSLSSRGHTDAQSKEDKPEQPGGWLARGQTFGRHEERWSCQSRGGMGRDGWRGEWNGSLWDVERWARGLEGRRGRELKLRRREGRWRKGVEMEGGRERAWA